MIPPAQDEHYVPCPNNLQPSILGTCRLIYQEARYVLYCENSFHAHGINKPNPNAVLVRHVIYRIGLYERKDGEDNADELKHFLVFLKELRIVDLVYGFDLIRDPGIHRLACRALHDHPHLKNIKIESPFAYSGIGWKHTQQLNGVVRDQAAVLEWLSIL
jgi:hypothetical protein